MGQLTPVTAQRGPGAAHASLASCLSRCRASPLTSAASPDASPTDQGCVDLPALCERCSYEGISPNFLQYFFLQLFSSSSFYAEKQISNPPGCYEVLRTGFTLLTSLGLDLL